MIEQGVLESTAMEQASSVAAFGAPAFPDAKALPANAVAPEEGDTAGDGVVACARAPVIPWARTWFQFSLKAQPNAFVALVAVRVNQERITHTLNALERGGQGQAHTAHSASTALTKRPWSCL